jgi:hypothetical protein
LFDGRLYLGEQQGFQGATADSMASWTLVNRFGGDARLRSKSAFLQDGLQYTWCGLTRSIGS